MLSFNQNKNIKILSNVYMQNYSNAKGGGIGDFFRGSFFILQFCIRNNLIFDVDYQNHPVSKYLYKKINRIEEPIDYANIEYYYPENSTTTRLFYNEFINYLHSKTNKQICLFSNNYPFNKISKFEQTFLRDKFLPTEELTQIVNNKIKTLGLEEKMFVVIHIRVDDSNFINDTINHITCSHLYKFVDAILKVNYNSKILLLSNSNAVKAILKKRHSNLVMAINNIAHLRDAHDDSNIRDTLCDLFLISKAKKVFSASTYGHGTGFSKYICKMYDIPYFPVLIKL